MMACIHELWERAQDVWNELPADECARLVASMPERISAVFKAKGGFTRY